MSTALPGPHGAATLAGALLEALDRRGDALAIGGPEPVRARDLAAMIRRLSDSLDAAGVGKGEPVALLARGGVGTLAALLALRHVGAVAVLPDPHAAPDVTLARLSSAGVRMVWASPEAVLAAGPARVLARRRGLHLPARGDLARLGTVAALGTAIPGLSRGLKRIQLSPANSSLTRDGDAVVVPTSGTTGAPRSVVHTDASLRAAAAGIGALAELDEGALAVCGTFFAIVPALLAGATIEFPAPAGAARAEQLHRAAFVYLTPPELRDVLVAGARFDRARVFAGSAPVSHRLLAEIRARGASAAFGVYAMTEIIPVAAVEAEEKVAWVRDNAGDLLGRCLPGVQVRIGAGSQIELRGPSMAHRYLGGQPLTWVETGDLGWIDPDAGLVLVGRAKEMILRRAENIYPGLYEPRLHVSGVRVAVLVGVSDDDGDEMLAVVAEPEEGADLSRVGAALREVYRNMGEHRPDLTVLSAVPLAGRSRKPDRVAASALARAAADGSPPEGAVVFGAGR